MKHGTKDWAAIVQVNIMMLIYYCSIQNNTLLFINIVVAAALFWLLWRGGVLNVGAWAYLSRRC